MQLSQRKVRGSEAEKDNLIPKFLAMRVHSWCSSLFFYAYSPEEDTSKLCGAAKADAC